MARTSTEIDWVEHRYVLLLGLLLLAIGVVFGISAVLGSGGGHVEKHQDEKGRWIYDYYQEGASRPYKISVYGLSGELEEEKFDRDEDGKIESMHFYSGGELAEQAISIYDDGFYDLRRRISGDTILEQYDRNHDGFVEEKKFIKNGVRVKDELDWNRDGVVEQRIVYDEHGKPLRLEMDYNSDGTIDTVMPRVIGSRKCGN